jgi:glycosyltransferase involved in cell wall biosynthesis
VRVGYFGTWERGYPRNEQVISALRSAGAEVSENHAAVWETEHKFRLGPTVLPRLIAAEARLAFRRLEETDVLLVGYPGQFDLWSARRHDLPVAFNAMVSLYDAFVEDRGRFRPETLAARALLRLDRSSFRAADLLIADTAANAAYMAELAGLDRIEHCYVGAEERLFGPTWAAPDEFVVLFVGKLIPLHGLRLILDTAVLLPEIPFRIVGSGQEEELLRDRPANVEHVPWVAYDDLPQEYARAGCALGIFGMSPKVDRVIPNKAFQALAVGTPLVTADTEAARELLTDERDSLLVERSPEALAAALRRLAEDSSLARRIGAAGRATFEQHASEAVLGRRWVGLLETLL